MIHIYENKTLCKIVLEDNCTREDTTKLILFIKKDIDIKITFLNINHLKSNIIHCLNTHKNKLKLFTNNKSLWLYLKKLSIDIIYSYHKKNTYLQHDTIKAIGIGGSAGSLRNIIKILKALPLADISVFIVMHILPHQKNNLVEILQQTTNYMVKEAFHGETIKTKHIYIASPDFHMRIEKARIYQSHKEKVNFCRPAIDVLFNTLAIEYKSTLLAIITSGYLDDGCKALAEVKQQHGTVIIQNPNQCEANDMPRNAIKTNNYDYILDLDNISSYINDKLNFTLNLEDRVLSFTQKIEKVYGYDFTQYDQNLLSRRIELLRKELKIESFNEFEKLLLGEKEIFELLFEKLSINASEFFRDGTIFEQFRDEIVPILNTYPHIRVWSSGCSAGQEPYSIAILLDQMGLLNKSIIYATDFNELIINQAKNGLFSIKDYQVCKQNFKKIGGKKDIDEWFYNNGNYVEIKDKIKNKVQFFQHNLVTDGEVNEFHIIFCRNVLIYFDKKLQNRVIKLINSSLIRNGFLVLGNSEHIIDTTYFKRQKSKYTNKIFKKTKNWIEK